MIDMCVLELSSLILWLLLYLCKLGHVPAPQFVNSSLKILDMFFSLQFWSVQSIFCVMFFLFSNSTFVSSESAVSNNSFHSVHSKHSWQAYFLFWDGKNMIYCICFHDLLVLQSSFSTSDRGKSPSPNSLTTLLSIISLHSWLTEPVTNSTDSVLFDNDFVDCRQWLE